jgi:hypothetical protein
LERFGVVVPNNPMTRIHMGVGLDREDKLFGLKKDLFHKKGIRE